MRKLTIVIKPFKVDAVVRALDSQNASAIHLIEARGYGRQKGHLDLYRDEPERVVFLPKVRLECAVEDDAVEGAIDAVIGAARTGRIGDGKILVEELA
ncbi:MAG: P-II family nitrogen regulator [Planctomycetota bacterium]